jgi:hypothetical protein
MLRELKPSWRGLFGEPPCAHEHAFSRTACSTEVAAPGEADSVSMALAEVAARWRALRSPQQLRQSLLKLLLLMERIRLPRSPDATRDDD